MSRKERMMQELEGMWREYSEKLTNEEWVKRRLGWEDWRTLRARAVEFAAREVRLHRWRGAWGGVVPRGFDAEAIASEAIAELFAGKGRLRVGWTWERLQGEIERLIQRKVRLLSSLKESRVVRSEWDVESAEEDGTAVSVFSGVAGAGSNGYEAVAAEEGVEGLRARGEQMLAGEPELKRVFGCICEGATLSAEIARRLGMEEAAVVRARRRLGRRLRGKAEKLKAEI